MKKLIAGAINSVRKGFRDTFTRSDAASLGTSSDGSLWNVVRGTFSIASNKAVGDSASYPMATVTMPTQNAAVSLSDIGAGGGAALWVTDSGNWWAVGVYRQSEDCNCTEYYNSYTYSYNYSYVFSYNYTYSYSYVSGNNTSNCAIWNNGPSCCAGYNYCASYNTSNCCGYSCNGYNSSNCCGYSCYGYNAKGNCKGYYCSCYNGSNCQGNYCSCYNGSNCNPAYACTSNQGCNSCIEYNASTPNYANANANATGYNNETATGNATGYNGPYYNCQTCYPSYLRVFRSVSNVVTTVVNQLIGETAPQSMKVLTSGEEIRTKVYSDTSLVTQIGSDIVYTATGAAIAPAYGITVVPSNYSQSYSIGEISIEKN